MKILITGGAGFVGSSLARYFRERTPNAEVTALDNLRRRGSELNLKAFKELGIRFVHGDIRIPPDFAALGGDFDLFVEASAEPSVLAGLDGAPDYVIQTNLAGTANCLNFARQHADKFVFLSTSRVYSIEPLREIALDETPTRFEIAPKQSLPGISTEGISEVFPTHLPRSIYGATKLASEYLVQEFADSYGLKSIIYRCGVVAGPGQFGKTDQGVFTMWVAHHYFKKPLEYTGFGGKGKQVRDLLHPWDLFALISANKDYSGAVFNAGGGPDRSVSLQELTALCERIVGNRVHVSGRTDTTRVDVPLYISDSRRATSRLGWNPTKSVVDIVTDICTWIRQNESDLKIVF